jgi:hypothetical protein
MFQPHGSSSGGTSPENLLVNCCSFSILLKHGSSFFNKITLFSQVKTFAMYYKYSQGSGMMYSSSILICEIITVKVTVKSKR